MFLVVEIQKSTDNTLSSFVTDTTTPEADEN